MGDALRLLPTTTKPYGLRNADYTNGNDDIWIINCRGDGNKGAIAGDRTKEENPSAYLRFVAADGHLCHNIHVENLWQHDAKRLGCAFANVEGLSFTGLIENNGRDAFTLQSNCSKVRFDYVARGCGDDGLGINSEQNPELVHDLHDVKGKVTVYGPGDDGPGIGMTVRGGRDIDIDLTAEGIEGWGVGIFDAYATKAKNITVRGDVRSSGRKEGDKTFYSSAAVVLGGDVIHKSGGPHAGVEGVDLSELKVDDPVGIAVECNSARGAYGSMQHIWLPGKVTGAKKSHVLGDYLSHIVLPEGAVIRNCVDGFISTHSNILRLRILDPEIYNIEGGTGLLVENATTGVITGWKIDNDGKNGQTGIKLSNLFGTWKIHGDYVNECTTSTNFTSLEGATIDWGEPSVATEKASAATLTLGSPPAVLAIVTGTTTIKKITAAPAAHRVTLLFKEALTVKNGENLKLGADFAASAGSTLTLVCDGTNWYPA